MASFDRLWKLTAETRAQWAVAERSLPRYAMHQTHKHETWKQIENHLETIATMGADKATLSLEFFKPGDADVSLKFSGYFAVKLPGEFWDWWRAIDLQIQSRYPNKNPAYLEYVETVRKVRKWYACDAIDEVVMGWAELSDIPVTVQKPEQVGGHVDRVYTFDWSGSENK